MQPSSKFSLVELPKAVPRATYRRRLVTHGVVNSGPIVHGDKIEFEFSNERYTVLATSYDYFDGCEHWIYLLKVTGEILDFVAMPDVFGFTQNVEVVAPEELSFGYFGTNDRWNLRVWEAGFWSFSPRSIARRMNRFLLSKRHLSLSVTKGPPWFLPETPNPSVKGTSCGKPPLTSNVRRHECR